MGTRSLTFIHDRTEKQPILCIYRQMGGYPRGMGQDLYDFLKGIKLTNGIQEGRTANGVGCLAAQLVAHLKNGPGSIYIQSPTSTDSGQEYEYHITGDTYDTTYGLDVKVIKPGFGGKDYHRMKSKDRTLFEGKLAAYGAWLRA